MRNPNSVSRRDLLVSSGLGGVTFALPGMSSSFGAFSIVDRLPAIRSCAFVFYYGGPSHLDTYDLKPDASSSVRGEFDPISTSMPGLQISEHLPRMSMIMHKVALVRSMHHRNNLHDSASTETFTGRQGPKGDREEFGPIPQFYPCHGAVLSYLNHVHGASSEAQDTSNPCGVTHATLPWLFHNVITVPCQGGGFLGRQFDPFTVSGDAKKLTYRSDMLSRPDDLSMDRISERRRLVNTVERAGATVATARTQRLQEFSDQAYELLQSEALRKALDIEQEERATRERYGMAAEPAQSGDQAAALAQGRVLRGQNLLIARRLVEAGIPFVNVQDFRQQGQNWDSHANNFEEHKRFLLPQTDQSLSALIEDLDDRGMLDSTLVVALGEFGRTPKINGNAGRDHWPACYTILLAGGGIRGGTVYGSSDRIGAYPATNPTTPADLAATIYWRFGIDPRTEVHDATARPHRLSDGRVLTELFG